VSDVEDSLAARRAAPVDRLKAWASDVAERVGWTFVQAFVAAMIASGGFDMAGVVDMSIWQKAGMAAVAAVLALVKGVAATWVGDRNSASLP
jgi:hypothetical protein